MRISLAVSIGAKATLIDEHPLIAAMKTTSTANEERSLLITEEASSFVIYGPNRSC